MCLLPHPLPTWCAAGRPASWQALPEEWQGPDQRVHRAATTAAGLSLCAWVQTTDDRPHPSLGEGLKERTSIKAILEASDEGLSLVGKSLCVAGWVKTGRQQGSGAYEPWAFLELNDGSTLSNLQVWCACGWLVSRSGTGCWRGAPPSTAGVGLGQGCNPGQ